MLCFIIFMPLIFNIMVNSKSVAANSANRLGWESTHKNLGGLCVPVEWRVEQTSPQPWQTFHHDPQAVTTRESGRFLMRLKPAILQAEWVCVSSPLTGRNNPP